MSFVGVVFLLRCFPRWIANVILAGGITVACTQLLLMAEGFCALPVVVIDRSATGPSAEQRVEQKKRVFADRTSFRAKRLHFVPHRWHCPAP